jgi:hypothetical protein
MDMLILFHNIIMKLIHHNLVSLLLHKHHYTPSFRYSHLYAQVSPPQALLTHVVVTFLKPDGSVRRFICHSVFNALWSGRSRNRGTWVEKM